MKKLLTILVTVLAISSFAASDWNTNLPDALKKAEKEKKYVLVDFSGSDWCGWCIKLDKEVFSKKEFKKYAKDNLILVLIDFPRNKKMSMKEKAANNALAQKYKVQGFPTVLLMDSKGKVILTTGYKPGGPEKYIEHLKEAIEKQKK